MKFYSNIDLKGTARLIHNDHNRIVQPHRYNSKYQLSKFCTKPGGIAIKTLNGNINIFNHNKEWIPLNLEKRGNVGIISISNSNSLQYISISTPGNSEAFGELSLIRYRHGFATNGINNKGVLIGGWSDDALTTGDHINMITFTNAIQFNPQFIWNRRWCTTNSNRSGDRAVTVGGVNDNAMSTSEYMTISTLSNSTLFGNLSQWRYDSGSCNNGLLNRMVIMGGYWSSWTWTMDYISITTPNDSVNFGNISQINGGLRGCSNAERGRGIFSGHAVNNNYYCTIEYISISRPGNSYLFGKLSGWHNKQASIDNGVGNRVLHVGVRDRQSGIYNLIEYSTISHWNSCNMFGYLHYDINSVYDSIGCSNS